MAVLRRKAPESGELFIEQAPIRDDHVPIPRALVHRETKEAAYTLGLTEDHQAEVAMLMGTRALDFRFLQRCRQNAGVRTPPGYAERVGPVASVITRCINCDRCSYVT